jgi:hypothetical protein
MARKGASENGHERLAEAMALLIQNQAAFLGRLADIERATSERFGRIEKDMRAMQNDMAAILRVLSEHSRLLERLPEAVRDKIGFKGQP